MSVNAGAYLTALGGGSVASGGAGIGGGLTMVGAGASAFGSVMQGKTAMELARADAESARFVADKHAAQVRRAVRRQVGSAKVATAGSGVALDEFSRINTDEIERMGAQDEAQVKLDGELSALSSLAQGRSQRSAGYQQAAGTLLKGASMYAGWRGAKGTKDNDPESLSYFYGRD